MKMMKEELLKSPSTPSNSHTENHLKSPPNTDLSISSMVSYGTLYPQVIESQENIRHLNEQGRTFSKDSTSTTMSTLDPELAKKQDRIAYFIFFCLGIGSLLPWNAFITAATYYSTRFCNESFENSFESFFSMFYTASQPLGLLFTIYYKKNFSSKRFVRVPLLIYTFLFFWTTMFVLMKSFPAKALFGVTLIFTFICGLCSSIMNGGLFGISGILPSSAHTAAIMNGQGLVGFIVSLISLIIVASDNKQSNSCDDDNQNDINNTTTTDDDNACNYDTIDYGAFVFFLLATIMLVVCVLLFYYLLRLDFVRYYLKLHLKENIDAMGNIEIQTNPLQPPEQQSTAGNEESGEQSRGVSVDRSPSTEAAALGRTKSFAVPLVSHAEVYSILQKIRIPAIAVTITYMMSLSVFPPLLVQMQSIHNCSDSYRSFQDLWIPLLFLIFNLGDFLGRVSAQYWPKTSFITAHNIWIFTSLRIFIILGMFFCKIDHTQLPVLFPFDAAPIILLLALGFSNGFYANLCMMFGPTLVEPEDGSLAGTIMVFCLCTGLLLGSCLSFLVLYIVTGR